MPSGRLAFFFIIALVVVPNAAKPMTIPMPMPKYARTTAPCENPYVPSYTPGVVVKSRWRYPYTIEAYVERVNTIGETMSSFRGRDMARQNTVQGEPLVCNFGRRGSLPVCFHSRAALRMCRTGAYDSRKKNKPASEEAPAYAAVGLGKRRSWHETS